MSGVTKSGSMDVDIGDSTNLDWVEVVCEEMQRSTNSTVELRVNYSTSNKSKPKTVKVAIDTKKLRLEDHELLAKDVSTYIKQQIKKKKSTTFSNIQKNDIVLLCSKYFRSTYRLIAKHCLNSLPGPQVMAKLVRIRNIRTTHSKKNIQNILSNLFNGKDTTKTWDDFVDEKKLVYFTKHDSNGKREYKPASNIGIHGLFTLLFSSKNGIRDFFEHGPCDLKTSGQNSSQMNGIPPTVCYICGRPIDPQNDNPPAEGEHVVHIMGQVLLGMSRACAHGFEHVGDPVVMDWACKCCNRIKSQMSLFKIESNGDIKIND